MLPGTDVLPDSVHRIVDNLPPTALDTYVGLAGTRSRSVSTPLAACIPCPETPSDAPTGENADKLTPRISGAEQVTGDPGRYFAVDETGIPTLIVPCSLKTQDAVKVFVTNALSSGQLNKGVRRVKCSRCRGKKANKLWDIKPSNLERHIWVHSSIKCYGCPYGCGFTFTTKDQMNKHIMKWHPPMPATTQADANRRAANGQAARDIQMISTPAIEGLPVGVEEWMDGQTHQLEALQAQYMGTLDNSYDPNY
ncbi:hypothetical protein FRC11_005843 [Ceratobasidium sp. 423]|nr:hypothetical protein FRC11_005843 [Ceratobasidium sp. 423]